MFRCYKKFGGMTIFLKILLFGNWLNITSSSKKFQDLYGHTDYLTKRMFSGGQLR